MLAVLLAAALALAPQVPASAVPAVSDRVWAKPDHFWYRKTVPGGHLWLTVDAKHGAKSPLFDHQRLAIELSLRTGREFTPLTLPFADPDARFAVKYDGSNAYIQEGAMAVEFIHGGQYWRCDLQIKWDWNRVPPTDYECLPRRPATPADSAERTVLQTRRSPDGRWDALIENHNVVIRPAAGGPATILSRDGSATDAYQLGSIEWSPDSQSISAYRVSPDVWTSDSVAGNVKKSVSKGSWRVP